MKTRNTSLIVLISCIFVSSLFAQTRTLWEKTFGGSANDQFEKLLITANGDFVMVGTTRSLVPENGNVYLFKTNLNGDSLWSKNYGRTGPAGANAIRMTADLGLVVGGTHNPDGTGNYDYSIFKFNALGDSVWAYHFDDYGLNANCHAVCVLDDGSIVSTGYDGPAGNMNTLLVHVSAVGDSIRKIDYGSNNGTCDTGYDIIQTIDGGFMILAGAPFSGFGDQVWLIKTDRNGVIDWDKNYGGTGSEVCVRIRQLSDGSYVMVGRTNSYGAGDMKGWLLHVDQTGNQLGQYDFGDGDFDQFMDFVPTSDGNWMLAGFKTGTGDGGRDGWLVKVDSHFNKVWEKIYGGTGEDVIQGIQESSPGEYVVCGNTGSIGLGGQDAWLFKVKENDLVAHYPFNGNANDESGNENHGAVSGAILMADRFGNENSAYGFDGVDDFITVPHSSSFNFGVADFSITLWVKLDGYTGANMDILRKKPNNIWEGFEIQTSSSNNNKLTFGVEGHAEPCYSGQPLITNKWTHLCYVRDVGEQKLRMYIDGELENTINITVEEVNEDLPLCIGASLGGTLDEGEWFKGAIDDIKFYGKLLTEQEIQGQAADTPSSIYITSPNGGEIWQVGSSQRITWTAAGTSGNVKIEYSTDNGTSWIEVVVSTPDDGEYVWTVPDAPFKECLIRVTDINGSPADQSDAVFTIYSDSFDGNGGVFLDARDNVAYKWVRIGNQIWMAENLKATQYQNGDTIPEVTDDGTWSGLSTGARCSYDNNESNVDTYGYLYNGYAVGDARNIAPVGWHVPTDAEWKELEMYLGMSRSEADNWNWRGTNEGSKLASNAALWDGGNLANNAAFDESGFTVLPGGRRTNQGLFNEKGMAASLWSATDNSSNEALIRDLVFCYSSVDRGNINKQYAISVRLLKGVGSDVSLKVTPGTVILTNGQPQQFTCTATYPDQSTSDVTSSVTWSIFPGTAGAIDSGGLFTAHATNTGTETITATYQGQEDQATVIVLDNEIGTLTGNDGTAYQTVKIGNQWWMAENLKETQYRNGDAIPEETDDGTFAGLSTGARCVYNNNESNADTYGYLYNWHAVMDARNIAPAGWHVPTDEEWKDLEMTLGMSQADADKMYDRGTNEGSKLADVAALWLWDGSLENNAAFGESGFSALPGGYRRYYDSDDGDHGGFGMMGMIALFGSATEYDSDAIWCRVLDTGGADVMRHYHDKSTGFSVRLIKETASQSYFTPVAPTGPSVPVIIQSAAIDGSPLQTGDEVGIFDGSLCVGAGIFDGTYPLTITVWMEYAPPSQPTLLGAHEGNSMVFKVWDQSAGVELGATPTCTTGSGVFGETLTVVNPLKATTPVTQTIALEPIKLNLISFNVQPADVSIATLLDDVETLLVAQDDAGSFYIPPYSVNTIGNADLSNGYQVYYTDSGPESVVNEGTPLDPTSITQSLTNTKLYMICNPYQTQQDAATVFASITGHVVVVQDDAGGFWIPAYGVNNLGNLIPGKGYQIFVDQALDFTYPAEATGAGKALAVMMPSISPTKFQFTATGQSHAVVVTDSDLDLSAGDEIGLYDGDLCVGAAVFEGRYPLTIAAWQGINQQDLSLPGYTPGNAVCLKVLRAEDESPMPVRVQVEEDRSACYGQGGIAALSIEGIDRSQLVPSTFALHQNYPNPFNPETTIQYELPEADKVSLVIYNTMGQEVIRLVDGKENAGYHQVVWDGRDSQGNSLSSGIYLCRIHCGAHTKTLKLIYCR